VNAAARRRINDLIRRCYVGLDARELGREVLQRIRPVVPIDAGFFATVDPTTMLFTSTVSEDPLIDAAPLFLSNELSGRDLNRFTEVAAAPTPVRWLDQITEGNRFASDRYTSIMRPLSLGDELRVALRTGVTCWGVMCLHREDGAAGFTEADAAVIGRIAPHVAEGLRRAMLIAGFESATAAARHGVVVLAADGSIVSMNDAAERWLADLPDADWPPSVQVPIPVLSAASAARSAADGADVDTSVRVRTTTGRWLVIHASTLRGNDDEQTVVLLEPAEPSQLSSLILDAHGLTPSQAGVVALVLRGYSTQQIVNALGISAHTVQEHLKHVFDKLGIRSRRELAATLLHPPTIGA